MIFYKIIESNGMECAKFSGDRMTIICRGTHPRKTMLDDICACEDSFAVHFMRKCDKPEEYSGIIEYDGKSTTFDCDGVDPYYQFIGPDCIAIESFTVSGPEPCPDIVAFTMLDGSVCFGEQRYESLAECMEAFGNALFFDERGDYIAKNECFVVRLTNDRRPIK